MQSINKSPRNGDVLASFVKYCEAHPEQRFWQALRNWSNVHVVCISNTRFGGDLPDDILDTFYWEGRNADSPSSEEQAP